LLLLFALAEFVRPPAAPPQRATVAQAAKPAGGEAAPPSTSNLNLNGDVSPGNNALHALVGAVAAEAGGGDALGGAIGAGAGEAARGIDITGKLFGIDPDKALRELEAQVDDGKLDPNSAEFKAAYEAAATEYQQLKSLEKAINQGASLLVGGAASGLARSDAMTGAGAAWSGEQFNRQLHDGKAGTKDEIGKLKEEAAIIAKDPALQEKYGLQGTEEEILNQLRLAAFNIVKYGDEIPLDSVEHQIGQNLQKAGGVNAGAVDYLKQFQGEGYFVYDETSAAVDAIASGRQSLNDYKQMVEGLEGPPIFIATAQSNVIERGLKTEQDGGYLDINGGHNAAEASMSYVSDIYKALSDSYKNEGLTYRAKALMESAIYWDAAARYDPQSRGQLEAAGVLTKVPILGNLFAGDQQQFDIAYQDALNASGLTWAADRANEIKWTRMGSFAKNFQAEALSLELGVLDVYAPSLLRTSAGLVDDIAVKLAPKTAAVGSELAAGTRAAATEVTTAGNAAKNAGTAAIEFKVAPPVTTPYGPAVQADSAAALAARAEVEKGATLYRVGTMGKSEAAEAQFWTTENPLTTPGYAEKYGIPAENIAKADFFETATLKPGAKFVTRPAPGVGANQGGAIEVVVEKGGVKLNSFSTGTPGQ
jgi:hypothetical protein